MQQRQDAAVRSARPIGPRPVTYPRNHRSRGLARTDPRSTVPSPTDAVRHWPAKPSHLIQDVAREVDLSPPPCGTARSKAVSDDRRVSEERVLHAGLPMIARRLRSASPSYFLDLQDRVITSARPQSVSRHVGRTRRRNHDGRATRTGGLVIADRIVGGIRRHPSEGARSYAGQFPTWYFVLYFGCTLDFLSRSCTCCRHEGQVS